MGFISSRHDLHEIYTDFATDPFTLIYFLKLKSAVLGIVFYKVVRDMDYLVSSLPKKVNEL